MTLPLPRCLGGGRRPFRESISPGWGGNRAEQSLPQAPSLTFSTELVRDLLNEPASVKVDEVRLGRVEREFRLSLD